MQKRTIILPWTLSIFIVFLTITQYSYNLFAIKKSEQQNSFGLLLKPNWNSTTWVIARDHHGNMDVCSEALAFFKDSSILIIAPTTPRKRNNQCIYFTPSAIEHLRTSVPEGKQLSDNLLACLYAIQNGAEFIYIPPGGGFPDSKEQPHVFSTANYSGLVAHTNNSFSPELHFGCRTEESNIVHSKHVQYEYCKQKHPAIQAPVVLPEEKSGKPSCDPRAPPITIQEGTLVKSFHFDGALYTKHTFWALPVVYFNTSQWGIWQIIVQKLLWLTGNKLMLWNNDYNRKASQRYNKYKPVSVINKNEKIISKSQISCNDIYSCFDAILSQYKKFADDKTVNSMILWQKVLRGINYSIPMENGTAKDMCILDLVIFNPVNYSEVQTYSNHLVPIQNIHRLTELAKKTCANQTKSRNVTVNFQKPWGQFKNILLIVIYNFPNYHSLPFVEVMYRPFFPYILYCGPGIPNPGLLKGLKISFISYHDTAGRLAKGALHYECTMMAIGLHFPVDGFMVVPDDILLSLPLLQQSMTRSHSNIKYKPNEGMAIGDLKLMRECKKGVCSVARHQWQWSGWQNYHQGGIRALDLLKNNEHKSDLVSKCYQEIVNLTGGTQRMFASFSDVYYIPYRISHDFAYLCEIFRKAETYMSMTIPTILRCLENVNQWENLHGVELESDVPGRYTAPWRNYKLIKGHYYFHPSKWGYVAKGNDQFVQFYCKVILHFLHDPEGKV